MTYTTTFVDATSLAATPTNLPLLPEGTFILPIYNPSMQMSSCLTNSTQQQGRAWDCANGKDATLSFTVTNSQPPQVQIISNSWQTNPPMYGPQPPQIDKPINVTLMGDTQNPGAGPAFYFQETYNKLVILKDDAFVPFATKRKRSEGDVYAAMEKRRWHHWHDDTVDGQDQPWYCWWNGTILETFVYLADPLNVSAPITPMSTPAPQPTFLATPQLTASSATSTSTSGYHRHRRQGGDALWNRSMYPKMIKIEERRAALNNNPVPYCQQMQLGPDGKSFVPIPNQMFSLTELEPGTGSKMMMKRHIADLAARDITFIPPKVGCECQWLIM